MTSKTDEQRELLPCPVCNSQSSFTRPALSFCDEHYRQYLLTFQVAPRDLAAYRAAAIANTRAAIEATRVKGVVGLLTNLAQLCDAWKAGDPETWTSWDQEQRDHISRILTAAAANTVKGDGLVELDDATPEQIERANAAVEANLVGGSPRWDSAQGYACALTAIMQADAEAADTITTLKGEIERRDEIYRDRLRSMRPSSARSDDFLAGYKAAVDEALLAIGAEVIIP